MIVSTAVAQDRAALLLVYVGNDGTPYSIEITKGSQLTVTLSKNKITIANSNANAGANISVIKFDGLTY